jgi:hypothetical protein
MTREDALKAQQDALKTAPKGYRQHKGSGKMQDMCPGCCIGPNGERYGTASFTADWDLVSCKWNHSPAGWDDPIARIAVWTCNNCSQEMPRRNRQSSAYIALLAERAARSA